MQPPYRAVKNRSLPRPEFLSLGASDILGWITLGCCELSKHWMFSSLSVSSDNQKYVRGLPNIPWEARPSLVLRHIMSLNLTFKALHDLIKLSFSALSFCFFPHILLHGHNRVQKISLQCPTPFSLPLATPFTLLGVSFSLLCPLKKDLLMSQDSDQKPLLRRFSRYLEK